MSREICHVCIRWLEAWDTTLMLEVDQESSRNRLAYWLTKDGWANVDPQDYTAICKRELLRSLYPSYATNSWTLASDYSVVNPTVIVKVPVMVFDLWPSLISPCGWLKDSIDNIGVYDTFKKYITDLENIGLWLRNKGQAEKQGVYGTVVNFYAAWDFESWLDSDGDWDVTTTFCGWFDLASATMQHCVIPPKMERRVVVDKC